MTPRALKVMPAIITIAFAVPSDAANDATRSFRSAAGYALRYPARWTKLQGSNGRLLILGPGHRVQGPIIGPGQALILIRFLDAGEEMPAGAAPVALGPVVANGCRQWREERTIDDTDPGPIAINRSLFCRHGNRVLKVQLSHWQDDRRAATWRGIANSVALSVRFAPARR